MKCDAFHGIRKQNLKFTGLAGVFCAIVSQCPDSIVSKLNATSGGSIGQIIKENGLVKLQFSGLVPRIIMIGTLTGLQWWIYDTFKTAMGFKTTGGAKKK